MKITTLIENTRENPKLIKEHGLSLLIETKGEKILFDTGQSGLFLENMKTLGISPEEIDMVVLSHGHYDHGGGLMRFLLTNSKADVYLNENAFIPHYHGSRYIGLNPTLKHSDRLKFTSDFYELSEGISLLTANDLVPVMENNPDSLLVKEEDKFLPDQFIDEQYLILEEDGKRFCFSGCSHKGIVNIVNWTKPDVLVGGFHLMDVEPGGNGLKKIQDMAKILKNYPTFYLTGHCTGKKQYLVVKAILGDQVESLSTGKTFNF